FKPISLDEGEILYRAGFPGRNFFLVESGKILLEDENQNRILISPQGHFGNEELFKDGMRKETALATESTTLLAVNKRGFFAILAAYTSIKTRLSALRLSKNILQRNDFPWIGEKEVIRFIDRKHINVLYTQLMLPVIFLI
ncbi:MAG: cyclic nucleotide-binding domain-containing protein, partial [Chloroflexi bacterium]|nr:cyclic nucleotide-binding domain-containing protein [Chloroflexota bacterium]